MKNSEASTAPWRAACGVSMATRPLSRSLPACASVRGTAAGAQRTSRSKLREESSRTASFPAGVLDQLTCFLNALEEFAAERRKTAPEHALFGRSADPVPVSITKVYTSPWGTDEPITIPETCRIEMYWQLMPGEEQEEIDRAFFGWLDRVVGAHPEFFKTRPEVTFPIRWLPGSVSPNPEPLVSRLGACAKSVLGCAPPVVGQEGPCDMYIFHQGFGIPTVIFGPRGGNTHGADEYLEIDTAVAVAKSLLLFVCEWCGLS